MVSKRRPALRCALTILAVFIPLSLVQAQTYDPKIVGTWSSKSGTSIASQNRDLQYPLLNWALFTNVQSLTKCNRQSPYWS